jgi:hypothetical protein
MMRTPGIHVIRSRGPKKSEISKASMMTCALRGGTRCNDTLNPIRDWFRYSVNWEAEALGTAGLWPRC